MNRKENAWTGQERQDLEKAAAFLEEGRRILNALEARHTKHAVLMRLSRVRMARVTATKGGAE